jgi:hypothetical protein
MKGAIRFVILLLLAATVFSSCATQTQLTSQWKDPSFTGTPNQKIFVLALTGNQRNMMIWEGGMDQALTSVGVTPIPGSSVINMNPGSTPPDSLTLVGLVKGSGANLVMVSRLLNVNQVQTYVPGSVGYVGGYGYGGMGYYGYYAGGMGYAATPGYYETDTQYEVETNVFDIKTEKLIWSGASQTVDPTNATDLVGSISTAIVTNMVQTGVIVQGKAKK